MPVPVGSYNLERKLFLVSDSLILFLFIYGSGVQIPSAKSLEPLNFVGWALKYVGSQCTTCFMLHVWGLNF